MITQKLTATASADDARVREAVDGELRRFLARKKQGSRCSETAFFAEMIQQFLEGGKRLRPLFCSIGWSLGSPEAAPQAVHRLGAALELFHAFALIHDDIMDESPMRRGRPTVHRLLTADAPAALPEARRQRYGTNSAILVGDLALVWSGELLLDSLAGHVHAPAVLDLVSTMREELVAGQFRDLRATGSAGENVESVLETIRFKTATYTIDYPLRLGATLANAPASTVAACSDYAVPLGEAFQLRDDLLGLFGDPRRTGKSATDDLREGKATVLMSCALSSATPRQRRQLCALVGNETVDDEGVATVRRIVRETGAVAAVEQMILDRRDQALAVLECGAFPAQPRGALRELVFQVTDRFM
ncbi:polyprenyl synthetase family protein [Lentzea sp. BCCO 10_0061]|uniref:Polyprenyl synthetase family protein n=1 Tax=Lentzea sokolovensis TaxID=3095429 RepID=A0ABU4UPF1_9PSEU|nr:polyprenyl synthetase family protein [Lentzea sp. BCCO 10_0061]MDX8141373.1 polyprenyl synthetase family protein [Lentzea sp. BCCO 10_0061]